MLGLFSLFLIFGDCEPRCSHKIVLIKKDSVYDVIETRSKYWGFWGHSGRHDDVLGEREGLWVGGFHYYAVSLAMSWHFHFPGIQYVRRGCSCKKLSRSPRSNPLYRLCRDGEAWTFCTTPSVLWWGLRWSERVELRCVTSFGIRCESKWFWYGAQNVRTYLIGKKEGRKWPNFWPLTKNFAD